MTERPVIWPAHRHGDCWPPSGASDQIQMASFFNSGSLADMILTIENHYIGMQQQNVLPLQQNPYFQKLRDIRDIFILLTNIQNSDF